MNSEQKDKESFSNPLPQEWFFSFGYGHAHPNKFVRIYGTFDTTRTEMVRRHGSNWAFQYPASVKQEQALKRAFMTELKE